MSSKGAEGAAVATVEVAAAATAAATAMRDRRVRLGGIIRSAKYGLSYFAGK